MRSEMTSLRRDGSKESEIALSDSTVIQHFRQNCELSGFGSSGEALVVRRRRALQLHPYAAGDLYRYFWFFVAQLSTDCRSLQKSQCLLRNFCVGHCVSRLLEIMKEITQEKLCVCGANRSNTQHTGCT